MKFLPYLKHLFERAYLKQLKDIFSLLFTNKSNFISERSFESNWFEWALIQFLNISQEVDSIDHY